MSATYVERYGQRPLIGIYTDHPETIIDTDNQWTIQWLGPLSQETQNWISRNPNGFERHAAKVHDRLMDKEFGHVLYKLTSNIVDLSYISNWIDLEHTTYLDCRNTFALYRRDNNYKIKIVNVDELVPSSGLLTRLTGKKLGVIFIDCWPIDFSWQHTVQNFDFYQSMIDRLKQFNVDSYVFHTSFINLNIITPDIVRYIKHFVSDNSNVELQEKNITDLLDFAGNEQLAPQLENFLFDQRSVLIPSFSAFENWVQRQQINDWIVVGMHWNLCTHNKPLGFFNLKKLKDKDPNINIYSLPDCTVTWVINDNGVQVARLCNSEDYKNDSIKWNYLENIAVMK
jgi:hypothetical protein